MQHVVVFSEVEWEALLARIQQLENLVLAKELDHDQSPAVATAEVDKPTPVGTAKKNCGMPRLEAVRPQPCRSKTRPQTGMPEPRR